MVTDTTIKKGYKQTELGVIPEDWDVKKLGDVLKVKHGKSQKEVEDKSGKYLILGTGGLMGYTNNFLYDKPSVLIGRKGTIDKPQFMNTPFWTVDTLFYTEIFKDYFPKFVFYKFLQVDWYSYNEASGVPSLNAKTIENIELEFPSSIKEQATIADVLSDTDALIEHLEKLIAKKKAIKQGSMQQLLTGKKRLPGFTGKWEMKKLVDFLSYEQPTEYLVTDTEYNDNNTTPVLTAGKTFILGYTNEEHGIFNKLPVIIFDDFTTAIKFVDFPFKAKSSAMKMLKPQNNKVNMRFIYEMMLRIKYPLGDHKRHWIGEYQFIEIAVPTLPEEQSAIATILTDMDTEIVKLESQLAKYQNIKQGMMQQLLTGKIRIYANS